MVHPPTSESLLTLVLVSFQYNAGYRAVPSIASGPNASRAGAYLTTSSHPHRQLHLRQPQAVPSRQHLPPTRADYPPRSHRTSPRARRRSYSPERDELEDNNGLLSAEERGEPDEEDELEEDGGGEVSPHPLDHFANLGIVSRAPSRRGSPKPSHQRYSNSAVRTSPPSRAHSPPPLTFGQQQHQQHHVLQPPASLLSQSVSRSSSSANVKGVAELSALSMLASSELYELERKERERGHQAEHHQHQYSHHPPYQPHPNPGAASGLCPFSSSSSPMMPPVPPSCHHEGCQRSYRMALGVYHQSQAQSQNIGTRSTVTEGFPRGNDGVSPHEEYVSFPGSAPRHKPGSGGGARGNVHPSSPGSTDSSDLSRSPPSHVRHNVQHPHHFNPYARPSGKSSPGASRHFTPSTSPVLDPARAGNHHHHGSGPVPVPVPTMMSESAVRAGIRDELDDENTGDMDVDLR